MNKKWKNQRLWVKLTLMVLITVALTVSVLYLLLTNRILETTQKQEEEQLLTIAEIVAKQPIVSAALSAGATNPEIQEYANQINETYQLDFVVVMTMDRIRLTHPDPEKINAPFQGGDEEAALSGQETTSIGEGTLGTIAARLRPRLQCGKRGNRRRRDRHQDDNACFDREKNDAALFDQFFHQPAVRRLRRDLHCFQPQKPNV